MNLEINHDSKQLKEPVRIFVAATHAEWLPMKVLEFSIRETTSLIVDIVPLYSIARKIPEPQALKNRPRTPFSFQRFLIPELCEFKGKAIYLDADMLVFQDIKEVWNQSFFGCDLQTVQQDNKERPRQFSVMLLDCKQLNWNINEIIAALDDGVLDYVTLMYEMRVAKKIGDDILSKWNSMEQYQLGQTALLHYTDMNTQPWVSLVNPLDYLWVSCLRRALAKGFITMKDLQREVMSKYIRPSLLAQIDKDINCGKELPRRIHALDRGFVAPYRYLQARSDRPWISLYAWFFLGLRRLLAQMN